MNYTKIITVALIAMLSASCQWLANHRNYTEQGNIIAADRVAQLRTGMSKGEVAGILGIPVYENTFHTDRWTYVYTRQAGSRHISVKRLVLLFAHNKLTKIDKR